jgi:ATP phosphoribosyltransferase regulatory subunit
MTAEGAIEFEALEAQAASLMNLFVAAGYERVAPAFIQPASLFLDRVGEALRARTYVFTDPSGEELCLRPDLTIPVARVFLERAKGIGNAKFCYNGPAFRIQEGKPDPLRPREFRQAGIEYYGEPWLHADLEVLELTAEAVRRAGISSFTIKIGHTGLFTALLDALPMPARWRSRLSRAFWRPSDFSRELKDLSEPQGKASRKSSHRAMTSPEYLSQLKDRSIPLIGLRTPAEIVQRLADKAADASEAPLSKHTVSLIESYLSVRGALPGAVRAIEALFEHVKLENCHPLEEARALFAALPAAAGSAEVYFDAGFGRHFEYYTGMVFQIEVGGGGIAGQIAGGGRYDRLIHALSAGSYDVPAAGSAIHTERLLAAARRS